VEKVVWWGFLVDERVEKVMGKGFSADRTDRE
jgi:hypothetical protein